MGRNCPVEDACQDHSADGEEANSRLLDYKKAVQWFVDNWPRWLRE